MRLVELLQIAGAVIGIPVTVFMAVEQRLLARFHRAGATSAEAALELPGLRPLLRRRLGQLESRAPWSGSDHGACSWTRTVMRRCGAGGPSAASRSSW